MRNIQCLRLLMILALFIVALTSGCVYAPHTGTGDPYNTVRSVDTYRIQRDQLKNWYHAQLQAIDAQEAIHPSTRSNRTYYKNQRRVLSSQYDSALKTIAEQERAQRKLIREQERSQRQDERAYRNSPMGVFQDELDHEKRRWARRTARDLARGIFR